MCGDICRMFVFDIMVMIFDGKINNDVVFIVKSSDNVGVFFKVGENVVFLIILGVFSYIMIFFNFDVLNCFVAAIVFLFVKFNRLYYWLKVIWIVEFSGFCFFIDIINWYSFVRFGVMSYGSDYEEQFVFIIREVGKQEGMVDVGDVDITKVMEGFK